MGGWVRYDSRLWSFTGTLGLIGGVSMEARWFYGQIPAAADFETSEGSLS